MTTSLSWAMAGPSMRPMRPREKLIPSLTRFDMCFSSVCVHVFWSILVRERPDSKIIADVAPEAVEPLRLYHQEKDDQETEDDQSHARGHRRKRRRVPEIAAEGFDDDADGDRQHGDEDGTEDAAEHRAEAADDDHRQIVDGDDDLERLVVGDAEIVGVEDAAHAGVERGDGKGQELVAENVDADDFGGDILVADGDEGATDAAAHDVEGGNHCRHGEGQEEEIELALGLQLDAEDGRAGHLDGGLSAARDGGRVVDHPLD